LMTSLSADTGVATPSSAAAGADLVVLDTRATAAPGTPSLSQPGIAPGGTLTLNWTLKNRGTSATAAAALTNQFYLKDRSCARPNQLLASATFNGTLVAADPATP